MEDYTYHFGPGEPKILGAHMLEVCPTIAAGTPSGEIHPLSIGNREDPVRLPRPSLSTSAEAWLTAGGPHHTVLSAAVGVDELSAFAEMVRTELLVIDEATTTRQFAKEIRWNQAYHRLADGL